MLMETRGRNCGGSKRDVVRIVRAFDSFGSLTFEPVAGANDSNVSNDPNGSNVLPAERETDRAAPEVEVADREVREVDVVVAL